MFSFWIFCAVITFLGYLYKYYVSGAYRGLKFRGKDWFLILCPFVNAVMTFFMVGIVGWDIIFKISDFFSDDRR